MYFLHRNEELTIEMAKAYIEDYKVNHLPRLKKNKRYYDCQNDAIMQRTFKDETKPNNKYATPWAKYITTLISGYFMGKPVTYGCNDERLKEIISQNAEKEITHNQRLEKDCSIYGLGAEILFINENKEVEFDVLDPTSIIPIYSSDIHRDLLYVIRFWEYENILNHESTTYIDIHSKKFISRYECKLGSITKIEELPNVFGEVNINIYYNNADGRGDAENVLKLIDGYDFALSDTANFREELNDSYLVFKNTNIETDDIIQMKQRRIINIEDAQDGMQSSVDWLNKDSNDAEQENYKTRLAEDIKKFSFVADIEVGKSHTTATSAKIGLLGIEQVCVDKESQFRKGLIRRIQLICTIERIKGVDITDTSTTITFVRNVPIDISLIGDTIAKLAPYVSKRTLLGQIPFVTNIEAELQQKQEEERFNAYNEDIFKEDDAT